MHIKPVDLVMAVIGQLDDRELKLIQSRIATPCQRNGHSYKPIAVIVPMFAWLTPFKQRMACTKCGHMIEV